MLALVFVTVDTWRESEGLALGVAHLVTLTSTFGPCIGSPMMNLTTLSLEVLHK